MNCTVTSAKNFSGQSGMTWRTSPGLSAESVRKSTLERPFIRHKLLVRQLPTIGAVVVAITARRPGQQAAFEMKYDIAQARPVFPLGTAPPHHAY